MTNCFVTLFRWKIHMILFRRGVSTGNLSSICNSPSSKYNIIPHDSFNNFFLVTINNCAKFQN